MNKYNNTLKVCQWDKPITMLKADLINFYITWCNDFLTIDAMSDYYGMNYADTKIAIDNGRRLNNKYK